MAGDPSTVRRPLTCRIGLHRYVQRHPDDERLRGPDHQVCRRCGKRRGSGVGGLPPSVLT
jgi:hypothetical protein